MDVSRIGSGASLYASGMAVDRAAEAAKKPPTRQEQNVESTKVQLSALGQARVAAEQAEAGAKAERQRAAAVPSDAVNRAAVADRPPEPANPAAGARQRIAVEARRAASDRANEPAVKPAELSAARDRSVKAVAEQAEKVDRVAPGPSAETLRQVARETPEAASRPLPPAENAGAAVKRPNEAADAQRNAADLARQEAAQRVADQRNQQMEQARTQTRQAFGFGGVSAYKGVLSF